MPERGSVEGHGHLSPLVLLIAIELALGIFLYIFLRLRRQLWVTPSAEERSSLWTWKLFLEQFARLLGSLLRNLHEARLRRGLTSSIQMASLSSQLSEIRDLYLQMLWAGPNKVSRVRGPTREYADRLSSISGFDPGVRRGAHPDLRTGAPMVRSRLTR
jgi:hypothetical protein